MIEDDDAENLSAISEANMLICPSCKANNSFHDALSNFIGICDRCAATFWISDCHKVTVKCGNLSVMTTADFVEAIDKGKGNTLESEINLRKQLWRSLNDNIRNDPDNKYLTLAQEDLFNKNLQRLLELLDDKTVEDRITKAECYRELGNFKAALELLSNIQEIQEMENVNSAITNAENRRQAAIQCELGNFEAAKELLLNIQETNNDSYITFITNINAFCNASDKKVRQFGAEERI